MRHTRVFSIALVLAILIGCASGATPARKTYTAIADVESAVLTAMNVFNARYQAGQQTEADRTKALQLYADWQVVGQTAEAMAQQASTQASALTTATAGLSALLNGLTGLGVPPVALPPPPVTTP